MSGGRVMSGGRRIGGSSITHTPGKRKSTPILPFISILKLWMLDLLLSH
jgi:hypothetical protein